VGQLAGVLDRVKQFDVGKVHRLAVTIDRLGAVSGPAAMTSRGAPSTFVSHSRPTTTIAQRNNCVLAPQKRTAALDDGIENRPHIGRRLRDDAQDFDVAVC